MVKSLKQKERRRLNRQKKRNQDKTVKTVTVVAKKDAPKAPQTVTTTTHIVKLQPRTSQYVKPTIKEEAKVVSQIPTPVVTKKARSNVAIDLLAYSNFVRRLIKYYQKRTDMATTGHTIYFGYYFWYLLLLHIKRVGIAAGTMCESIPDQVKSNGYAVPFPLAAYLQYMSPYLGKGAIGPIINMDTGFFGTPAPNQVGIANDDGVFPSATTGSPPVSLPNMVLCDRILDVPLNNSDPAIVQAFGDVYVYKSTASLLSPSATIVSFVDFIGDSLNVEAYSNYVKNLCSTIPLSAVPAQSPDCTGFGKCGVAPLVSPTVFSAGVYAPNNKFDPELVPMFSIATSNQGEYNNLSVKSMVPPKQLSDTGNTNYWDQIVDVFIYGYDHLKRFKPGPAKNVIKFGGQLLKSFYPQFHYIDGTNLSQHVYSSYKQLIANKGQTSDLDTNLFNFTNLMAVAYYSLQRRFNMSSPVDTSVPYSTFNQEDSNFQIIPQFVYADAQWASIRLPVAVAKFIESVGPTVNKGTLRVPMVNYNNQSTATFLSNSTTGPFAWSTNGYTGLDDEYFGTPNLYTNNIRCLVEIEPTGVFPNIAVSNEQGTGEVLSLWETNNVLFYYGGVVIAADESKGLSPAVANSTAGTTIITNYKAFVGYQQQTNVVPLVTPRNHELGSFAPMNTIVTLAPVGGTTERLHQQGFLTAGTTQPEVLDGMPIVAGTNYANVACSVPLNSHDLLDVVTGPVMQSQSDPNITLPVSQILAYTNYKRRKARQANMATTDTVNMTTMISPHSVDPPDNTSAASLFDSIAQATLTPNTKISDVILDHVRKTNLPFNDVHTPLGLVLRPYVSDIANQLSSGLNPTNDSLAYYTPRAGVTSNDIPKTNGKKHHPALKAIGDMMKIAKGGVGDAVKVEQKISKYLGRQAPKAEAALA